MLVNVYKKDKQNKRATSQPNPHKPPPSIPHPKSLLNNLRPQWQTHPPLLPQNRYNIPNINSKHPNPYPIIQSILLKHT